MGFINGFDEDSVLANHDRPLQNATRIFDTFAFATTPTPPDNMKGLQSLGLGNVLTHHNAPLPLAFLVDRLLRLRPAVRTMCAT